MREFIDFGRDVCRLAEAQERFGDLNGAKKSRAFLASKMGAARRTFVGEKLRDKAIHKMWIGVLEAQAGLTSRAKGTLRAALRHIKPMVGNFWNQPSDWGLPSVQVVEGLLICGDDDFAFKTAMAIDTPEYRAEALAEVGLALATRR